MKFRYFGIPQIIAICFVGPVAWMALDRRPPLILYDGQLSPSKVQAGQTDVKVVWRAKFAGRDCGGLTQRELIDSKRYLWPALARSRAGIFQPDPNNKNEGTVVTPPLSIPDSMSPGRATYRVSQFYYCNALQRIMQWPIVAVSPPIEFEVLP
ncbi:MAG TPA: hypothetical protein VK603_24205 [Candidatus Saccharimonadales bacterium]|nr:hypothetical protein [Candidatus Saccharimonadales bacterium]